MHRSSRIRRIRTKSDTNFNKPHSFPFDSTIPPRRRILRTVEPLEIDPPMGAPEDKGNVAYWSYFLLGAGVLAPWNAFITAVDYFGSVYPYIRVESLFASLRLFILGNSGGHMDRKFSICYLPTMMVALIVMIAFHNRFDPRKRILVGFAGFSLVLLVVPILDAILVRDGKGPPLAAALTLLALVFTGVVDGIAQGAVLGDASYLPEIYQQAYASGTGASGVLISILRMVTKASLPGDTGGMRTSTILYFTISASVCILCFFLSLVVVPNLPIIKYYKDGPTDKEEDLDINDLNNAGQTANVKDEEDVGLVVGSQKSVSLRRIIGKLMHHSITLIMIYVVTLSIFPGVPAEDVHSDRLGSWYNVLLIGIYNLADFIGKLLPAIVPVIQTPWKLTCWSFSRLVFIPTFYGAVVMLPKPSLMFLLIFALGITNGFLTVNTFILGPQGLRGEELQVAGNVLVLALVTGLVIGAFGGWLWLWLE